MARNPDPFQLSFLPQSNQNQHLRYRSLEPQLELSLDRLQQWKQAIRDFQQQVRTSPATQGTLFDLPSKASGQRRCKNGKVDDNVKIIVNYLV